jgi:hypothetical protein
MPKCSDEKSVLVMNIYKARKTKVTTFFLFDCALAQNQPLGRAWLQLREFSLPTSSYEKYEGGVAYIGSPLILPLGRSWAVKLI